MPRACGTRTRTPTWPKLAQGVSPFASAALTRAAVGDFSGALSSFLYRGDVNAYRIGQVVCLVLCGCAFGVETPVGSRCFWSTPLPPVLLLPTSCQTINKTAHVDGSFSEVFAVYYGVLPFGLNLFYNNSVVSANGTVTHERGVYTRYLEVCRAAPLRARRLCRDGRWHGVPPGVAAAPAARTSTSSTSHR